MHKICRSSEGQKYISIFWTTRHPYDLWRYDLWQYDLSSFFLSNMLFHNRYISENLYILRKNYDMVWALLFHKRVISAPNVLFVEKHVKIKQSLKDHIVAQNDDMSSLWSYFHNRDITVPHVLFVEKHVKIRQSLKAHIIAQHTQRPRINLDKRF